MSATVTNYDAALKQYYSSDEVQDTTYKANPFYALVPKDEEYGGNGEKLPIIFGNPQGVSGDLELCIARASSNSSQLAAFVVTHVKKYGVARIANELIEASRNDRVGFLRALTNEIDGVKNQVARAISLDMYRQGYGEKGTILAGSAVTGTTLQLSVIADAHNFEIGQELIVSADVGSSATRALGTSGNGLIVTKVNRNTGVLTFGYNVDDATNGIPAIAAGDTLFVRGDRATGASPARTCVAGVQAWCPSTDPSGSDSFFGVNRSVDSRLFGQYFDSAGLSLRDALIQADARVNTFGGQLTHVFMHPLKFADLTTSLQGQVQYVDVKMGSDAKIGFRGVLLDGMSGDVKIIPDRNCPYNRMFGVDINCWKLISMGKAIRVFDADGTSILRTTGDEVEFRAFFYGNLLCNAPAWQIQVAI